MKVERTLPNLLFSLTLAKNNTIQKAKAIKTNAPISSVTPEAAHLEPCCIDQPLNVFWLSSFDTFETCPLFMVPKNVLSVSQREQKSKRMSAYVFEMKHGYTDSLSIILSQKKWGSVLGPLINSDTKHTHTYTHTHSDTIQHSWTSLNGPHSPRVPWVQRLLWLQNLCSQNIHLPKYESVNPLLSLVKEEVTQICKEKSQET